MKTTPTSCAASVQNLSAIFVHFHPAIDIIFLLAATACSYSQGLEASPALPKETDVAPALTDEFLILTQELIEIEQIIITLLGYRGVDIPLVLIGREDIFTVYEAIHVTEATAVPHPGYHERLLADPKWTIHVYYANGLRDELFSLSTSWFYRKLDTWGRHGEQGYIFAWDEELLVLFERLFEERLGIPDLSDFDEVRFEEIATVDYWDRAQFMRSSPLDFTQFLGQTIRSHEDAVRIANAIMEAEELLMPGNDGSIFGLVLLEYEPFWNFWIFTYKDRTLSDTGNSVHIAFDGESGEVLATWWESLR